VTSAGQFQADGLRLATEPGPDGPRLSTDDPQTAPLAAVLNAAATGALEGLDEALRRGEGAETPIERVRRPYPGDEFPAERERWRRLTGEDPGEDVYVVGTSYTPGVMVVPRAALRAGLEALRALRHAAAPADGDADTAWLAELEERAADVDRLEAADEIEQRARAAVKRRLLLAELDALPAALDDVAYPLLGAYQRAAAERRRYAASEERARALGSSASDDPTVSLDWFRFEAPAPDGWSDDAWLAHAEAALRDAQPPAEQAESELYVRDGAGWTRIAWRREDDGRPVVLRAERG
jgi:hypothetical protein